MVGFQQNILQLVIMTPITNILHWIDAFRRIFVEIQTSQPAEYRDLHETSKINQNFVHKG